MAMLAPLPRWSPTRTQAIAHRGRCSLTGPENTLAGAIAALDAGCDGVEIDLRRTKDGHLVLMHDPTPMRTTFARVAPGERVRRHPVETSSLADLRTLGVRTPDLVEHPELCVPLLSDVLLPAARRGALVFVDVKDASSSRVWPDLERELSQLSVTQRSRVVVQSRCADELLQLQRVLPEITTSLMVTWSAVRTAGAEGGPAMTSRPWWAASGSTIAREHAHGRRVFAWTVNKQRQMADLIGRGVDGIITDEPLRLLDLSEGLTIGSARSSTLRASA